MEIELQNLKFKPRPGGWERLNARIDALERGSEREFRRLAAAACVLFVILAGFLAWPGPSVKKEVEMRGEVQVLGGSAVRVPGTPPEVRFFWVIQ